MRKSFLITVIGSLFALIQFPLTPLQAMDYSLELDPLPYRAVRQKMGYQSATPAQGEVNMLVIPISFSDFSCASLPYGCEGTLHDIERAFFGEAEDTTWESVKTFYQESSFNQLHFSGMVTPWFTPSITAVQLSNNPSGGVNANVMFPAVNWFKESFPQLVANFDSDQDGFLDAVYLVYSVDSQPEHEAFGSGKDVFWAFTAYVGGTPNVQNPHVFHYCWSSYDFMYMDGYYDRDDQGRLLRDPVTDKPVFYPWLNQDQTMKVDAHVYIHEVGHLLGLFDYYSYDQDEGDWGALGGVDMMDYNVGDHNPYSKALLGWSSPTVIEDSIALQLAPYATTGASLLISPSFQQTLMDEYLIIEYYTPESLFEADSIDAFAGRYPKTFSIPGIRIYHVDSRVAASSYVNGRKTFNAFVTSIPEGSTLAYDIAHSNTASRSLNPNHRLIHLLESSGQNSFKHQGYAINSTLFQTGMVLNQYPMNSGANLPFIITIGTMSHDGVQLTIQKLV
jgi:M6 family metalloprotease-like protein